MVYLLDANITITANNKYYPIDRVPEFWDWLQHQGESGNVKMPLEIFEEVKQGRKDDPLVKWITRSEIEAALLLRESVDAALVQRAVQAYAPNLTDDEVEQLGRDPFLIAYALASSADRCVVTVESSRPAAQRQNRRVPDICNSLGIAWCDPFQLNTALGFSTRWRSLPTT